MELKNERRKRLMSQTDLAKATGLSRMSISRYENGTRRPSPETAKKIASVLGFPWTKFYE